MVVRSTAAITVLAIFLAGCATTRSPAEVEADQVRAYMSAADTALARRDSRAFFASARLAAGSELGRDRLKQLFTKSSSARATFIEALQTEISEIRDPRDAVWLQDTIDAAGGNGLMTLPQLRQVQGLMNEVVERGISSGGLLFTLTTGRRFTVLGTPEHQRRMFQNSLASLSMSTTRQEDLTRLAAYINALEGADRATAETQLANAGLRRADLDTLTSPLPSVAAQLRDRLAVSANFKLIGGDRLLEDDLRAALRKRIPGITYDSSSAKAVTVRIEKVRHQERTLAERKETVTYAQHEVDIAYAVMLMPRNASYMYEITSTAAELEYGYVVAVEGPGGPRHEQVVRGTARAEQVNCSNARIQNVFGGVTSAGFIANSQMAGRCQSSSRTLADLRADVFEAVANAAAGAPQLKSAAD